GAQKRLNELVNKAKNFLQSNLLNKFQEVKKEVIQFIADKGYNHKAYLTNQSEIDQLFAQTSSEQRPQEPTWKKQ
ncbi:1978_t:CDS:2, partial [Entrophospora sp. SA101]